MSVFDPILDNEDDPSLKYLILPEYLAELETHRVYSSDHHPEGARFCAECAEEDHILSEG